MKHDLVIYNNARCNLFFRILYIYIYIYIIYIYIKYLYVTVLEHAL